MTLLIRSPRGAVLVTIGVALAAALGAAAGGCSSHDDEGAADAGGGSGGDSSILLGPVIVPVEAGAPVITSSITDVTVTSTPSGPLPTAPDGSDCQTVGKSYTLDYASRYLTYVDCEANGTSPFKVTRSSHVIDMNAFTALTAVFARVTRIAPVTCAADQALLSMSTSDAHGTVTYAQCGAMSASGLDDALAEAASLVQ